MDNRTPISVRISRKVIEATDIASFELVDVHGRDLPAFDAGSHIDVEAAPNLVRQYSLCNNPSERNRYLIGVLREPNSRGGSRALIDKISVGDVIQIAAPRNLFRIVPHCRRAMLLAGGIGVTPIIAMAEQLADSGTPFAMHYASRSRSRMAFQDRIAASGHRDNVTLYFDDDPVDRRLDLGRIFSRPDQETHIYTCGPAGFIQAVLKAAGKAGWPSAQLHTEYFAPLAAAHPSGETFSVKIASTGQTYLVPPERSVVEVLSQNGIEIPVSCEQGVCGTCVTRVVDGVPDHRDMFMTDDEHARNDQFTPCCSRSKSRELVLDL